MNADQLQSLSPGVFLRHLADQDVELRLQDGKLRVNAPEGVVSDALRVEMVRRKDFLLRVCQSARSLNGSLILREPPGEYSEAPLTHAQERLWLLERFHPGNFAYNIPEVFELPAPIESIVLQRAIDYLLGRHEALRTRILESDSRVVQRVSNHAELPLAIVNLMDIAPADRETYFKTMLRQESRRPFDLTVAPLARFLLFIVDPQRRILLINLHHIIADRWSTQILYSELLEACNAFREGHAPKLPEPPIRYGDYAVWERSSAAARMHRQQLGYWKRQLSDLPDPLALPFAKGSSKASSSEGAVYSLELTAEDTAALRAMAKARAVSLYMLLLAAYCALLRRYTGALDMCIGSPVSERTFRETEPLIGLFVNTLVMRCKVSEKASFLDLLALIRDVVLDAHANRDVPLQEVISSLVNSESGHALSRSSSPLFQTMLAFDPLTSEALASKRKMVELDPGFAKFDLTLQLREDPDCVRGWIEYRTDVATEDAIRRFAEAFLRLLHGMLASPTLPIETIEILSREERQLLLRTWNDTAMPFPRDKTIHQMFVEQAERTPQAVAVIDGRRRITYSALDRASNVVAHQLLKLGVEVEDVVGIRFTRSAEMIAAMLGILKAGAAYIPIDTQLPKARIDIMLGDCACSFVVTDTDPDKWSLSATPVRIEANIFDGGQADAVHVAVCPGNLAYVIYTSGSTGTPKGVAIEHHSTVSFLTWGKNAFAPEVLQGTLASTSISFDLSVFEIFAPLTSGGTVILAQDILALPTLPALNEVTLATTVPSAAAAILEASAIPRSLRNLNLAGELLPGSLVDRLLSETQLLSIHDLYGPTETTTYSTWTRRSAQNNASIGRPIGNTRTYLLDESLQLVPIGVIGELFIAGEGVARGYLNRPDLTAQRFVSLRHLGEEGRVYRTGDLCRYNPDGTLVFHGRSDHQVKVNGFRIELGEIEAVLRGHLSVAEAVVIPQSQGNAMILAAAIRPSDHGRAELDLQELLRYQAALLPPHMIVRRLVPFNHFPVTRNGKIDRKQLSVAISATQRVSRETSPPTNELEREVLKIWREGFVDDTIGIDDDFFQIGGHSLLALRLFSDIESRLGHRMLLSVLFQAPTVRHLAAHLRAEHGYR